MKDFILFFEEKEGTSAMVRWADRFENINVVHHENGRGWSPWAYHLGHSIRQKEIIDLLTRIYLSRDMDGLRKHIHKSCQTGCLCFERQRLRRAQDALETAKGFYTGQRVVDVPLNWAFKSHRQKQYFSAMVELMQRQGGAYVGRSAKHLQVGALQISRRRSRQRRHLQFKLASGAISKKDIPKVQVNLKRFGKLIDECRRRHNQARVPARSPSKDFLCGPCCTSNFWTIPPHSSDTF